MVTSGPIPVEDTFTFEAVEAGTVFAACEDDSIIGSAACALRDAI